MMPVGGTVTFSLIETDEYQEADAALVQLDSAIVGSFHDASGRACLAKSRKSTAGAKHSLGSLPYLHDLQASLGYDVRRLRRRRDTCARGKLHQRQRSLP
jgi:hypothetical protein